MLALTLAPAIAYLALIVVGLGNALEDVGVFTLVLRLAGLAQSRRRGSCTG